MWKQNSKLISEHSSKTEDLNKIIFSQVNQINQLTKLLFINSNLVENPEAHMVTLTVEPATYQEEFLVFGINLLVNRSFLLDKSARTCFYKQLRKSIEEMNIDEAGIPINMDKRRYIREHKINLMELK